MRVATYNIRHGVGMDGRYDLVRTAEVIRGFRADLVALQEVDVGWARSSEDDQPAILADLLGMHVAFHATVERPDGKRYGIAAACPDPLEIEAVPLPRGGTEEPRAAIVTGFRGVRFVSTHLTRDRTVRARQLEALRDLATDTGPVVVAGDLNSNRRGLSTLLEAGLGTHRGTVRTMPARFPRGQIDHILAGGGAEVSAAWSVRTSASDHRPLIAEIEVP